jgi:hypothetical protein
VKKRSRNEVATSRQKKVTRLMVRCEKHLTPALDGAGLHQMSTVDRHSIE